MLSFQINKPQAVVDLQVRSMEIQRRSAVEQQINEFNAPLSYDTMHNEPFLYSMT